MDIEQTQTETEAPILDADAEPTDEDLLAAAKEAGGEVEDAPAVAKPKAAPAAAAEATEPDEPKIAAVLRAREKAFQERQEANDYAAERRSKADKEAAEVLAEARKRAAADYEAELNARRAKFRETPGNAIRELGFSTDELVDGVTREGTAEWKAIRAAEARAQAAEERAKGADAVKADFEAFKGQFEQERQTQARAVVEQRFLNEHASAEKAPYLHKRYDPEEIVDKAHKLANQWNAAGVTFAHSDVAEYLEHQARVKITGTSSPPQVSGSSGASKVKANGSRTLSAANGSERRASPKPIDEMTPDEERDALIEAVRDARRQNGG